MWQEENLNNESFNNVYNGEILICQKRKKKEAFRYESVQGWQGGILKATSSLVLNFPHGIESFRLHLDYNLSSHGLMANKYP